MGVSVCVFSFVAVLYVCGHVNRHVHAAIKNGMFCVTYTKFVL